MKKRNVILGIVLSVVCVFSIFGLAGCGEASIATIKQNFEALDRIYAEHTDVFVEDNFDGLDTKYKVSFGDTIDNYANTNQGNFGELNSLYNAAFVISNDYIVKNREYVLRLDKKDLSKDAQKKLDNLNESLKVYSQQIEKFLKERTTFVQHFQNFEGLIGDDTNQAYLRRFKSAFGVLVEKNVQFSADLAEAVEATEIFGLLEKVDLTEDDTGIVKEFIRAKMLPIFTNFKISEIANKMTWSSVADGDGKTKGRIETLMSALDKQYETYKYQFVTSSATYDNLKDGKFGKVFDITNEFFVEADAYFRALEGVDFKTLCVSNDNKLEEHKKSNKLAEVYLQKLEQFVATSLPSFMENVAKMIFA